MRCLIPVIAPLALLLGVAAAGKPPTPTTAKGAKAPAAKGTPSTTAAVPPPKGSPVPGNTAAVPAPAAPWQPPRPNLWELKSGTLSVTYTTSGGDGQPHLTYREGETTITANGPDIRTQETEVGTLVSITTRRTVDSGSTAFSLLIPLVNMESAAQVVSVNVVGITTHHRFSPVPAFNRGQVQLGSSVMLNGTAKRVTF